MLLNDFFFIENKTQENQQAIYTVKMNAQHAIYQGHFPNQAIAPGVCLSQMVKELAAHHLQQELQMISARQMKFMAILNPFENQIVQINLNIAITADNHYRVKAVCKNENTTFFKIDAQYKLAE